MESSARQNEPNIPDEGARVDKTRYRPIRLIGLLLILQVIWLGVSRLLPGYWGRLGRDREHRLGRGRKHTVGPIRISIRSIARTRG
jgi:hypothetical protein